MLKVLIVDDDNFSRTNLKTMIEWEKRGFSISGEASNGWNAVQLIEKEPPDIVITDMYMPAMNGLELIDYIECHCAQIRVIALSAYDDFDYVRQSMKKGAIDYVLKHQLDAAALIEMLDAARDSIIRYRNECDQRSMISGQLSNSKGLLTQEFFHKLVAGYLADPAEIQQTIRSLDLKLDVDNLVVAVAEIDGFRFLEEKYTAPEMEILIKTFLEIAGEILSDWEKAVLTHLDKGKFVMVFSLGADNSRLSVYSRLFSTMDRLRTGIKKYLNVTACFSVSRICRDLSMVAAVYREADLQLKNKFYRGKDGIFMNDPAYRREAGFFCLDIQDEKEITMALKTLDYGKIKELIDRIFQKIATLRLGIKSTQMICAELINIVNQAFKETGMEISKLYTTEDIPYNVMQKYETIHEMQEWLLSLYEKLIAILTSLRLDNQHSEITKKVIEFVNRNYRTDISLSDVAAFIGVSNSYISRVFKEESGIGFVEYLNRIRVENARHYIEVGEYRLKEIVAKTGFNNYTYFFKVFKEIAGMTPLEYEEQCRKYKNIK